MSEKPLSVPEFSGPGATLSSSMFLPFLTRSVDILDAMARHLDETGIDPSRYYYTDVEQVAESERYLREVLKK